MQDRFKFRYVFKKDFGGKIGISYKTPIFDLNDVTSDNFADVIKGYTDFDYKLISIVQSTSLKDKNGKLIFEGDIVYKKGSKNHKKEKMYSIVCFDKTYAQFNISDENGLHQMPSNSANVEIVGNIYENPELTKDDK